MAWVSGSSCPENLSKNIRDIYRVPNVSLPRVWWRLNTLLEVTPTSLGDVEAVAVVVVAEEEAEEEDEEDEKRPKTKCRNSPLTSFSAFYLTSCLSSC